MLLSLPRALPRLLLIAAGVLLAYNLRRFWPFTVDDSFITFRYSANLVAGLGPNFNAGSREEGYTTFLWMAILCVPHLLKLDAEVFSKIVGVMAAVGTLEVLRRWLNGVTTDRQDPSGELPGAVAVLLLDCTPAFAVHAVSGMETALFAFLLLFTAYRFWRLVEHPGRGMGWWAAGSCLLLGLTRPEGNLVAGAMAFGAFVAGGRETRRHLVPTLCLAYLAPATVYFVIRWRYYGHLFPLPFYVKAASQKFLAGRHETFEYAKHVLLRFGPLMALAVPSLRRSQTPAILGAACMVGFSAFPAHIMGYDHRYPFPSLPVLVLMAGLGVVTLTRIPREGEGPQDTRRLIPAAAVLAGVVTAFSLWLDTGGSLSERMHYARGMQSAHIPLGKELAAWNGPGPHTVAVGDAGAVPYFSGWTTIDTYGLNDPVIAIEHRRDAAYVMDQKPEAVVLVSGTEKEFNPPMPWEADLYFRCLADGYRLGKVYTFRKGEYYLWVYVRPDSRLDQHLQDR